MSDWVPLLELRRDGVAEVVVHGAVAWVLPDGTTYTHGNPLIFGRSVIKPFQFAALGSTLGLSEEQIALACSSHNGEDRHLRIAQSIIDGSNHGYLQLPSSQPLGGPAVETPTPWHNPCSGKHAAIIRGCLERGWGTNYLDANHPFHKAVLDQLRAALGTSWTPEHVATDGCGLPTHSLRPSEIATLFREWSRTTEGPLARAWEAMSKHPELIGGTARLDTEILQLARGDVIAKEGADGLLGLATREPAHGICIKLAHGHDPRLMRFVARAVLEALDLPAPAIPALHHQSAHLNPAVLPPHLR